jgi:hypothetical protein
MNKIFIKSIFYGWFEVDYNVAFDFAKKKLHVITTGKNDNDRLTMVNSRLMGVKFTLDELL